MNTPRLSPRTSRVILYFVLLLVAFTWWGLLLLLFPTPPDFDVDRAALGDKWLGGEVRENGATIRVSEYPSAEAARLEATRRQATIRRTSSSTAGDVFRYRRAGNNVHGLIVRAGNLVVQIEAGDANAVESALSGLPFLVPSWLHRHTAGVVAGGAAYCVLLMIGLTTGGGWAFQIQPAPGVQPIPVEEMRQRLLAINGLETPIHVREGKRGALVAEWRLADARWIGLCEAGGLSVAQWVRFQFDGKRHVAYAVNFTRKVEWQAGIAGVAASFSFFQGVALWEFDSAAQYGLLFKDGAWQVDFAYRYAFNLRELKQPLVAAVVGGGWTYRPTVFGRQSLA